jgi:cytoskeletal protein CcmA (bactofilin family)
MNPVKYIKELFFKKVEEVKELPCKDELHVSGILVQKDIVALDDVCVTQNVTGDIYCAKNITVCEGVQVVGNIYCRGCTLEGSVTGNISAYEMLEIKANAIISGDINTRKLNVSSNAVLNGYIANINVKDGKRIHADIKLKIDKIKHNNKEKEPAIPEIPDIDNLQDKSEELDLNPKTVIFDLTAERVKQEVLVDNNEKWW